MKPNWISRGAFNLLKRISESKSEELTWAKGGGWWIDNTRVRGGSQVQELIDMVLINRDSGNNSEYKLFTVSQDGKEMLKDPNFEPRIIEARRKMLHTDAV